MVNITLSQTEIDELVPLVRVALDAAVEQHPQGCRGGLPSAMRSTR
jgi:hypothetical protein